jgi:hypothetical protein
MKHYTKKIADFEKHGLQFKVVKELHPHPSVPFMLKIEGVNRRLYINDILTFDTLKDGFKYYWRYGKLNGYTCTSPYELFQRGMIEPIPTKRKAP